MFTSFSTQIAPDFGWVDFSRDSEVVGWSSFDTNGKILIYKIVDNILYVIFRLDGTSNSTSAYFTVPVNMKREFQIGATPSDSTPLQMIFSCSSTDNNTLNAGSAFVSENTAFGKREGILVNCGFGTISGHSTTWTSTGVKRVRGQFFIPI